MHFHCHFVLVFFSPFCIAITSLGEERANLSAFRTFVRFVLVWICRFPLPFGVWEEMRFMIVALLELFSYLFFVTLYISPLLSRCSLGTAEQPVAKYCCTGLLASLLILGLP